MAEVAEQPVNAGEQIGAPPTGLGVPPEAQYRMLAARLEEVAREVKGLAKPATFRIADMLEIAGIVIGVGVALFAAFGLNERIGDLSKGQAAAELRITTRLDRLSDQVIQLDERTSRLEGQKTAQATKPPISN